MVITETIDGLQHVHLLPNRSASWRQTKCMLMIVGGATLLSGAYWTSKGAAMVVPFLGLEMLLICWLAYQVCCATHQRQTILFNGPVIEVQWGRNWIQKRWLFDLHAVELIVTKAQHSLSPDLLQLKDANQILTIASNLNRKDQQQAIQELTSQGLTVRVQGASRRIALDGFPTQTQQYR